MSASGSEKPLGTGLGRYLRLYGAFLRFSFSKALQFRLDFYFRVVMDVVFYAVHLLFFTVIYRHTPMLGGWDLEQIYVFACGAMLVDAIHMTIFANNMWWLPIYINRGDLDYYLVRPVSSLFFLSMREVAANSCLNLILAAGLVTWSLIHHGGFGWDRILIYLAFLCLGAFIHYLIRVIFITPVFWLHSNRGLDEVAWTLNRLSEKPHQIYPGAMRWVLVTVLPLAMTASYPAHVLFDGLRPAVLLHVLGVTAALFVFVIWFWNRGLRAYSSASS